MTAVRDNDDGDDDFNDDEWKVIKNIFPIFTCVLKSIDLITANI